MREVKWLPVWVLVSSVGCSYYDASSQQKMSKVYEYERAPTLTGSLFASDQALLSNEAIDTILSSQVAVPSQCKLAVLQLGSAGHYRWWSEELARLSSDAVTRFIDEAEKSPRIREAAPLPALLTPEHQTVPFLREAAARFQADLLLVYRYTSISYEKQRLFAPDEVKSDCLVEAVLLDVRTGVVPFTSQKRKQYVVEKKQEDYSLQETIHRAELQSVGEALSEVGRDMASFLQMMPVR